MGGGGSRGSKDFHFVLEPGWGAFAVAVAIAAHLGAVPVRVVK